MSRRARTRTTIATLVAAGALLIPASQAMGGGAEIASAGGGPVATKSGAIVNFLPVGKLRVGKHFQPLATCAVDCQATGTGVLKGLGGRAQFGPDTGTFTAGQPFGLRITVKGLLLRLMKRFPGRFRFTETISVIDPATGATDSVSRAFKFKR